MHKLRAVLTAIDNIPGRYLAGAFWGFMLSTIIAELAATIHSAGLIKAIIWYGESVLWVLVAGGLGIAAVAVFGRKKQGSNDPDLG